MSKDRDARNVHMLKADIMVVGAGPAGAAISSVLAKSWSVVVVDRIEQAQWRIGESLIPAARPLLRELGLIELLDEASHGCYLGNRAVWGGTASEMDYLRDPNGPGWHLDRQVFERDLLVQAKRNGVQCFTPARLRSLERCDQGWSASVSHRGEAINASCRFIIDASGRNATVARRLGASHLKADQLISVWLRGSVNGEDSTTAGFSLVESAAQGWWYTAPVKAHDASDSRVLAFHTDADLADQSLSDPAKIMHDAHQLPEIGALLRRVEFHVRGAVARSPAHSAHAQPCAGPGWLAIGDAAISCDPIVSRGLFNALYTAQIGAAACDAFLRGNTTSLSDYAQGIRSIQNSYREHLADCYNAETRWPQHPFWHRRLSSVAA